MSGPVWSALTGLPGWEITRIPRQCAQPRPADASGSGWTDRGVVQRAQALAAACRLAMPVLFGWVRFKTGGPVRVLAAGPGLAAGGDARQAVLTIPAGARGDALAAGGAGAVFAAMSCWTPVAVVAFSGGQTAFEPSLPVEVVDVVGAGDAFAGGYLAARLGGATLRERLRVGHERAALTLRTTSDFVSAPGFTPEIERRVRAGLRRCPADGDPARHGHRALSAARDHRVGPRHRRGRGAAADTGRRDGPARGGPPCRRAREGRRRRHDHREGADPARPAGRPALPRRAQLRRRPGPGGRAARPAVPPRRSNTERGPGRRVPRPDLAEGVPRALAPRTGSAPRGSATSAAPSRACASSPSAAWTPATRPGSPTPELASSPSAQPWRPGPARPAGGAAQAEKGGRLRNLAYLSLAATS